MCWAAFDRAIKTVEKYKEMSGPLDRWRALREEIRADILAKGFDAKRFAGFNCATCHGKGVADKSFKMPNPDILALPGPDRPDDFKPIFEKHPDMVKFMGGKVMPEMARLLGREPFDYQNPKPDAFSCLDCHTRMP